MKKFLTVLANLAYAFTAGVGLLVVFVQSQGSPASFAVYGTIAVLYIIASCLDNIALNIED